MKKLTALILLALLLTGCASKPTEPVAPDFNITLPEGYSLSPLSDTECAIVREGETLGGLRLTDLGTNLKKVEDTLLYRYIDSLAPAPLIPEFMAMYWDQDDLCYIHVTLKITDSQGVVVLEQPLFVDVHKNGDFGSAYYRGRNFNTTFEMATFAQVLANTTLSAGESYHYTVTADLATFDHIVVNEGNFTYGA